MFLLFLLRRVDHPEGWSSLARHGVRTEVRDPMTQETKFPTEGSRLFSRRTDAEASIPAANSLLLLPKEPVQFRLPNSFMVHVLPIDPEGSIRH